MASAEDLRQQAPRAPCILAGCERLVRIENIDQVVRYATLLFLAQLGGSDIEVAIDLERVTIDDFALELPCQANPQFAFSGSGRAYNRDQGRHVSGFGRLASRGYLISLLFTVAGSCPKFSRTTIDWSEKNVRLPVVLNATGLALMV